MIGRLIVARRDRHVFKTVIEQPTQSVARGIEIMGRITVHGNQKGVIDEYLPSRLQHAPELCGNRPRLGYVLQNSEAADTVKRRVRNRVTASRCHDDVGADRRIDVQIKAIIVRSGSSAATDIKKQTVGMSDDGVDEVAQTRVRRLGFVIVQAVRLATIIYRKTAVAGGKAEMLALAERGIKKPGEAPELTLHSTAVQPDHLGPQLLAAFATAVPIEMHPGIAACRHVSCDVGVGGQVEVRLEIDVGRDFFLAQIGHDLTTTTS